MEKLIFKNGEYVTDNPIEIEFLDKYYTKKNTTSNKIGVILKKLFCKHNYHEIKVVLGEKVTYEAFRYGGLLKCKKCGKEVIANQHELQSGYYKISSSFRDFW